MSTELHPEQDSASPRKKVSIPTLRQKKLRGAAISMLTAYDFLTAQAIDQAEIDIILVGDSLGMVILGYENTLPVTMEEMLHHCKAVARGTRFALRIGDMPFLSYQVSIAEAVRNAGRFLQEAGMDAVKLEGGRERVQTVRAITDAGIPVMGHLGLTPQSVHQFGGFRPQARQASAAQRLLEDALELQGAGCFALVLESIPGKLAELVTQQLGIPTIGIGAGAGCDGQVLVAQDVLGMFNRFVPRFVKQYANLYEDMQQAFQAYKNDVERRTFPEQGHTIEMPDEEWEAFVSTYTPTANQIARRLQTPGSDQ